MQITTRTIVWKRDIEGLNNDTGPGHEEQRMNKNDNQNTESTDLLLISSCV